MKEKEVVVTLTQRQIWGVAILATLIIIAVVCWRLIPSLNSTERQADPAVVDWTKQQSDSDALYDYPPGKERAARDYKTSVQQQLFTFDPNTASLNDLVRLGLRPKVAQTIINYRNKGGRFYKKEDLAKIYTLSEQEYKRLLPYIKIADKNPRQYAGATNTYSNRPGTDSAARSYPQKQDKPILINTAGTEELMQLRGIGNGYANRIIKYREILGGYHKIEQLKEVYGMNDSLYEAIKPFIIIEPEHIKTIPINTASEEALYKHPYIRKMAKYVISYRNEIGGFRQVEDFKQVPLINEEIYRKIVPYLSLK
ncbi:MAG: helix-hairpin-helix domain-containing protein [Sphingobacteriales bacterium]|nr:MAG: helix-hairpin-helix domain-containing protein [Sphingobacteriales bacterium]